MRSRRQKSRLGAATFLLFHSSLLTKNFSSSRHLPRSLLASAFTPPLTNHFHLSKASSARFLSSSPFTESINDIQMFHYKNISSTQDEMKSLLLKNSSSQKKADYICITTESQTKGRGTNNRSWIGKRGNTFLTIAIPYDDIQIPLTLFPLQIGVVMAQNIQKVLKNVDLKDDMPKVTVKWPNDVLVNDKKIAGVLIENEKDCNGQYRFLVGIGVNNRYAPKVETTGEERGRETTCIYDYTRDGDIDEELSVMEARQLAIDIANDIKSWIEIQKIDPEGSRNMIMNTWLQWADFSRKYVLRDEPGNETVMPIDLESDGRLRVVGQDGQERLLCFDYLL